MTEQPTTPATPTPATTIAPDPTGTTYVYDPNDPHRPPDSLTPLDEVPDSVLETGSAPARTVFAPGEPQPATSDEPKAPSVPKRSTGKSD